MRKGNSIFIFMLSLLVSCSSQQSNVPYLEKSKSLVLGSEIGRVIKTVPLNSTVYDICVKDSYVYVAATTKGLRIIDATIPEQAFEKVKIETPQPAGSINIFDDYLFIAGALIQTPSIGQSAPSSLNIFDISDPLKPILIRSESGNVFNGSASNEGVFFAQGGGVIFGDLKNIRADDPFKFVPIGHCFDTYVYDDYCFISPANTSGIEVLDVDNPDKYYNVKMKNIERIGNKAFGLFGEKNILYVTVDQGMYILDISNPKEVKYLGSLFLGHGVDPRYIYVQDNYAFIGACDSLLRVVDVSNLTEPVLFGTLEAPGPIYAVIVKDEYCYVANGENGLTIIRLDIQ